MERISTRRAWHTVQGFFHSCTDKHYRHAKSAIRHIKAVKKITISELDNLKEKIKNMQEHKKIVAKLIKEYDEMLETIQDELDD